MRRSCAVLAVALALVGGLGIVGLGVEDRLSPTSLEIPGTDSSRAGQLLRSHFGESAPFAILLRGPAAELDRQGPALIRTLRLDPKVTTLSPWDRGAVGRLRPSPRRALILADFHVDVKTAVNETVPRLNAILARQIRAPVRATQSSFASISRALQDESISASERGELIALPFLLIVLLLVFRSPVAAAIPLGFGAVTVLASRGILYFLTSWFDIDAFALTVCTMMGLALGVDYALLMVSRFREELVAGSTPAEAARRTRRTAGRTTMFAGSTLLISMLVALFIVPGSLLASLAGTVAMVVLLSVTVATVVLPHLLILIGPNLDRWRIGPAPNGRSRLMSFVNAALKRPAAVAAVIAAVVLLLAAPALGLKTGPPSPLQLPPSSPARQDAELIDRAIGPGYDAPFQIVAATHRGVITDTKNLAALTRFQRKVAALPGVKLVVGPGQVARRTRRLPALGKRVLASDGDIGPTRQIGRLGRSLGVAAGGIAQLRGGIAEASAGAGLLAAGSGRVSAGARLIAAGLGRAARGSENAVSGLTRFVSGTKRLSNAQRLAALGALRLKLGISAVLPEMSRNALPRGRKLQKALNEDANVKLPQLIAPAQQTGEQLQAALAELQRMSVPPSDPNYAAYTAALEAVRHASASFSGTDPDTGQPVAPGYAGLPAELAALQQGLLAEHREAQLITAFVVSTTQHLKRLRNGAIQLDDGLNEIRGAGHRLVNGSTRIATAARTLGNGLARLSGGADSLVGGIDRLGDGAEALQAGLGEGVERSAPLQSGLRRASVRVLGARRRIRHQVDRVRRGTPGLFDSGYFVLSELDGAPPRAREEASTTVDLPRGGQAASMLVISRYSFNTPGSISLNRKLKRAAAGLGEETGLATGVAGGAAQLNEYSHVTRARIPYVIAAITLVTFLILIAVLRAIPLAAIAVALNLATVGVAFGILTLLFHVPASLPFGGHTYVDAVGATMIFGIVFGLSIDYAVFLLTRMREHYDRHGDNAAAISFGLEKTARVITGAAAIMMAVFIAFAGAPIATVSQLGVGLTVAVILDATVVRIVLLPALMLLIGDRVWWLPRRVDRLLPRLNV